MGMRKFTEIAGGFIAACISYMLSDYAQVSVDSGDDSGSGELVTATDSSTMRIALASVLLIVVLLTLMLANCMFKEMPIEERKNFYTLKRQIKDVEGLDQ